jgi:hypothetical protein
MRTKTRHKLRLGLHRGHALNAPRQAKGAIRIEGASYMRHKTDLWLIMGTWWWYLRMCLWLDGKGGLFIDGDRHNRWFLERKMAHSYTRIMG